MMIVGMFMAAELKFLRAEGYREWPVNKNGIRIA